MGQNYKECCNCKRELFISFFFLMLNSHLFSIFTDTHNFQKIFIFNEYFIYAYLVRLDLDKIISSSLFMQQIYTLYKTRKNSHFYFKCVYTLEASFKSVEETNFFFIYFAVIYYLIRQINLRFYFLLLSNECTTPHSYLHADETHKYELTYERKNN